MLANNAGLTYFGLQWGGECWGAASSTIYSRLGASTSCTSMCRAGTYSAPYCGGSWAFYAYQIKQVASAVPPPEEQTIAVSVQAAVQTGQCTKYTDPTTKIESNSYCWVCKDRAAKTLKCIDASIFPTLTINSILDQIDAPPVDAGLCPSDVSKIDTTIACTPDDVPAV